MYTIKKLYLFIFIQPLLMLLVDGKCHKKEVCKWVENECHSNVRNTLARCAPGTVCRNYQYLRRDTVCPEGYELHRSARCNTGNTENYRHHCCMEDRNYDVDGLEYLTPWDYENTDSFPDIVQGNIPRPHNPDRRNNTKSASVFANAWPNADIPYYINYTLAGWTMETRAEITKAIKNYEDNTCVRFHRKTRNDKAYVSIENDPITNTASNCGLSQVCGPDPDGGRQYCSVGPPCANAEWLVHELGHSLCFGHEHEREDRDTYIYFNSRVCSSRDYPRDLSPGWTQQGLPFDFNSIMMYTGCQPGDCFQRRRGQGSGRCGEPGDGTGRLSAIDIRRVNKYHKCDCNYYSC